MFYRRYSRRPKSNKKLGPRKLSSMKKSYADTVGRPLKPVQTKTRSIATTFWGKAWCKHINNFMDYENRLPRGRTYLRNGHVIDLDIQPGVITSAVAGSQLYKVRIRIKELSTASWNAIKKACLGKVDSMVDLLNGKLSDEIIEILCSEMFPSTEELVLFCDCPDYSDFCKHRAATLYAVGVRLDEDPSLLFVLRGVNGDELFKQELDAVLPPEVENLDVDALGEAFGIDIDK